MRKIVYILLLLSLFLLIGCNRRANLYMLIINHSESIFYLTVSDSNSNTLLRNIKVENRAVLLKNIQVKKEDNTGHFCITLIFTESGSSKPIAKDFLWYPSGGINVDSARGDFFVAVDIFLTEEEINVIYSKNSFMFGIP